METAADQLFHDVTLADLGQIRRYIRDTGAAVGCDQAAVGELIVAVNEAVQNIIRHSYQDQPGKIKVTMICDQDKIKVVLLDDGPTFNPTQAPSPDTTLPLEDRPFGGLGVHMMRDFCDELNYRIDPQGHNELTLIKSVRPSS